MIRGRSFARTGQDEEAMGRRTEIQKTGTLYKIASLSADPAFRIYTVASLIMPGLARVNARLLLQSGEPVWSPIDPKISGPFPAMTPVAYRVDAVGIGPYQGVSRSQKSKRQGRQNTKGAKPPGIIPGTSRAKEEA